MRAVHIVANVYTHSKHFMAVCISQANVGNPVTEKVTLLSVHFSQKLDKFFVQMQEV